MNIPSQVQSIFEQYFDRILSTLFTMPNQLRPNKFIFLFFGHLPQYNEKEQAIKFLFFLSKLLSFCKFGLLNGLTPEILMQRFAARYD